MMDEDRAERKLPIIYVRGYAGTQNEVEDTVDDPFYGFNKGATHIRVGPEGEPQFFAFESPLVRLMSDHGYCDVYEGDRLSTRQLKNIQRSIWIYRYYDQTSKTFKNQDGARLTIEAAAKGLGLRLVLAAPDTRVEAYPLMRVVANLVSNAIKYTREGRILIGLRRHGAGLSVEVHDTGPGLSGATFEKALRRNERLDRDRGVADGSGLGLSVVRDVADSNGWQVSSCEHRRSGATIRIAISQGGDSAGGSEPA